MAKTAIASGASTRIWRAPKSGGTARAGVGAWASATNSVIQSMCSTVRMLRPNVTGAWSTAPQDEPATRNSPAKLAVPDSPHEAIEKIEERDDETRHRLVQAADQVIPSSDPASVAKHETVPKAAPPFLVISPPRSDLRLFHDSQLAIEDGVRQCIRQPRPNLQEVATSLVIDPEHNNAGVRIR